MVDELTGDRLPMRRALICMAGEFRKYHAYSISHYFAVFCRVLKEREALDACDTIEAASNKDGIWVEHSDQKTRTLR